VGRESVLKRRVNDRANAAPSNRRDASKVFSGDGCNRRVSRLSGKWSPKKRKKWWESLPAGKRAGENARRKRPLCKQRTPRRCSCTDRDELGDLR